MGIMIYPTHGHVGFVEACAHVGAEIDTGSMPAGQRLNLLGPLWLCADCCRKLGFERFASLDDLLPENIPGEDDPRCGMFEVAYNQIEGRRLFCLECVEALAQG